MTDQSMVSAMHREELKNMPSDQIRSAIRSGRYSGHTAGLAAGRLQCNLAIIPERYALDFLRFCLRNPKPCPVVGVSETGNPMMPTLGHGIDIRTDIPRYRVFRDGVLAEERGEIFGLWAGDMVTVALGCSFTFENALLRADIPVRHMETGQNVPMYRSTLPLNPAGPFAGSMVVTMRPIPAEKVSAAYAISGRYPHAHGAPIGHGDPSALGIADLFAPDWGDVVEIRQDEVPVYWACGVTPQNVLLDARIPLCITHSPGHMLITDVAEDAESPVLMTV